MADGGDGTIGRQIRREIAVADVLNLSVTQEDVEKFAPRMAKTINLGPQIRDDWGGDKEGFVGEMYEQYLQAVQQGKCMDMGAARHANREVRKYDRNCTFEDYLRDALDVIKYRLEVELDRELRRGTINVVIRDNNKSVAEACIRAIRTYLEGSPRERMVGVPESGF